MALQEALFGLWVGASMGAAVGALVAPALLPVLLAGSLLLAAATGVVWLTGR